jgi:MGT family glycosyltransferase
MGRFLFVVPPLAGHVNPTLGLGNELLNSGHEVAWISFDPSLESKLPQGATFFLLESEMTDEEKEQVKVYLNDLGKKTVYGIDSLKFLYEEVLVPMNRAMLGGIKDYIDSYMPDIVINDHQIFAASVTAIQKGIPYVTSVTAPAAIKVNDALPMVYKWEEEQVVAFQKEAGIEGDKRLDCSSLLTLVYTSREFFGDYPLSDNYKFIGPVINRPSREIDFDWEKFNAMNEWPKILVSIGTTFDHSMKSQFFDKVFDAFAAEQLNVILVSDPDLFENIPENIMVCKQIPQLDLIPHMDAVVCHAGYNTVCESLSYAVPLVVIPIAYDQSYVAGCVVDSGAGVRLNFNRFKAMQLKDAVYSVLNKEEYKNSAREIQQSFNETGGMTKAVHYLEDILKK